MTAAEIILALVTLQRGLELVLARRNTRALLARGAVEIAPAHYPLLVVLHAAWLIALWTFGHDQPVETIALALYLVLQALRVWVMATLGRRWTTRIIVVPNAPLVTSGPYRYLRHPNYAVVAGEIALLPLTLHLPGIAVLFSVLNAAVLLIRIRAEDRGLAPSRGAREQGAP
ncbi:MAG TPA: isoprenylcysteine carboxylmethyltransferase family protein [Bradyrhizobium sp.]|uniref:isoprenylcysteine carboxyl methyltransferase family protein n=1 Tax=Bradyrhizobium sp. TaxID=376 RepID=UPI002D7F22E8|nr:isoprenylcysteine carboxylmethyltransferase family protein [Bradyrhizobium sp.]HET7885261.1 isoprenylcysteine carboxylmethyltransferase family protein [Bradyrhizobium sp.]